ncbi:O-antigen ligase family protein [Halobacillus sp. B23F22_1]|uniref:O-antigen ligase family protein n=1 Tax=Halobacillus sp. B23F22_1 TaxID=3459514 RepID=UPI00373E3485
MNDFKYWLFTLHILLIAFGLILPSELFGYIITIIIVGFTIFYSKNGLLLLFVIFPVRPFLVEINGGYILLADLILLTAVCIAVYQRSQPISYWIKEYKWAGLFLSILIVGLLSGLHTGISVPAGLFQIRALLITFLVIIFVKESHWQRTELDRIIGISIATALFVCVHGWVEKISSRHWLLPAEWRDWNLASANEMRIYGLLANPNVLATYLLIVFFSTFLLKNTNSRNKPLMIIRILLAGTSLLTYSRGTLLAFAAGAVVFIILRKAWKQVLPLFLYAVVSFSLIYYPMDRVSEMIDESGYFNTTEEERPPDQVQEEPASPIIKENNVLIERFKEMFSDQTIQASAEWGRIYVVLKGLEIFQDYPLTGSGFATYGDAASQSYSSPIYERYGIPNNLYTDNQYISLLVSTGIIGTLLFLTLCFLMIKRVWQLKNNFWRSISLSAIATLLVSGLFYNILEDKTFTLYFYFIIGYVLNKEKLEKYYEMD